ncbi:hypothetical protein EVAR_61928_1 [Eumeta japonica]|uniref:DDE-1 domain-containing protein n=1 Tax=Eumeta variegata TaxID=151549 RepID=A0A4C1ZKK0_EUMVA|nr:hypothetical protein EVAR_61928_1 [Eumeta japonica]
MVSTAVPCSILLSMAVCITLDFYRDPAFHSEPRLDLMQIPILVPQCPDVEYNKAGWYMALRMDYELGRKPIGDVHRLISESRGNVGYGSQWAIVVTTITLEIKRAQSQTPRIQGHFTSYTPPHQRVLTSRRALGRYGRVTVLRHFLIILRVHKINDAKITSQEYEQSPVVFRHTIQSGRSHKWRFIYKTSCQMYGYTIFQPTEALKNKDSSEPRLGRQTIFSKRVEEDLANRVKLMAKVFYECSAIQLEGFLQRNNVSVRKPEATSINRITAFNRREVELFYDFLEKLMDKHKFLPQNIYNCDETGISTVQDPGKILAPKGVKRVGSVASWERGKNITMLCAMSTADGFVPPMYIFPSKRMSPQLEKKRMSPQLEKDGPAGAIYKCSDNGWINENLFF